MKRQYFLHIVLFFFLHLTSRASAGPNYAELSQSITEERIRQTIGLFSSSGSRVAGYPGADRAAQYILSQFRSSGLKKVKTEEFSVTIPIDHGARLKVTGGNIEIGLYSIWPNLVRTSTLPKEGIKGRLIYGGSGDFTDFDGKDVEGSIVLMEFNTWNNWLNASMLGAQAIIFIEPDATTNIQAVQKFLQVPLSMKRFWIGKQDAQILMDRLKKGEVKIEMTARMTWEKRPAWNIVGTIPGTDPKLKDEIIVLESYYDAMSVVPALAYGSDMASGVTALLELARYLGKHPPKRTVILLATSAHCLGLRGVGDFLQRHCRKEKHYAKMMTEPLNVKLFVSLDLSSGTDGVAVWNSSTGFYNQRFFAPFGKVMMRIAEQVCKGLGLNTEETFVNGISPAKGVTWESLVPGGINVDSEIAFAVGIPSLAFVTVNDARLSVDTPFDRPEAVRYGNLTKQIRFLTGLLSLAFDDPKLFPDFRMRLTDSLTGLQGRAMTFPRRSFIPDRPRPGAVAVLQTGIQKALKGVRGTFYELVDENGQFQILGVRVNVGAVEAYYLDPETGDITYAPNRGAQGQIYSNKVNLNWWLNQSMTILFPCVATDFYDTVDPRYLAKLSAISVYGETNSAPEEYGFAIGYGPTEPVGVVFSRPGEKIKILMSSGSIGLRFLLLNSGGPKDVKSEMGRGFTILKQGAILRTSFQAAKDMWQLDEMRIRDLKKYGIENQRLWWLHELAKKQILLAEKSMAEKRWSEFIKHTRTALGLESRAYPDVKATQNDVIRGIIFILALVLPSAFFAERLLISASKIVGQIIGFCVIFVLIWIFMSLVHPAFQLSNPFVILLAFVILALSVLVIVLIFRRFNQYMKHRTTEGSMTVHETDVNRIGASYAGFMLGISNMRRRKLRTGLTFLTLLMLTFTVLSFTSIKSTLTFTRISRGYEGAYEGALIRDRFWNALEEPTYDYANTHFEDRAFVVPRTWYASQTKNRIKLELFGDGGLVRRSAYVSGMIGLVPEEKKVTGLDRCLIAGSWFEKEREKECIIPTDIAKLLRIRKEEVGQVEVRLLGETFRVRGIIDSKKMEQIKDLDDEVITPADFETTGADVIKADVEQETRAKQGLEQPQPTIKPFVHFKPANIIIVPYQILREAGGSLESVSVRFNRKVDVKAEIEGFISRLAVTLLAGIREKESNRIGVSVYSSMGLTSLAGIGNLFIPMLIAALIVLNTMMSSVYERFKEIGIYSSVGLAPVHISFLFMAESCVYAVLGVVGGYLTGQAVAKILLWQGWLKGFILNYSSASAMASALLVMAVVLLSTIYPAWKAAQMAVPDVTRRWKLPDPEGDHWLFEFPFTVGGEDVSGLFVFLASYFDAYREETVGKFYTEGTKLGVSQTDKGDAYTIAMTLWMAPFDLGVSEYVEIRALPTGEHNIYTIELFIERLSGEHASWKRVNQRFGNILRKQFLIWRTITPEVKKEYRLQGEGMMTGNKVSLSKGG